MSGQSDNDLTRWALGAVATAVAAGFTWVWNRIQGLEARQDQANRDLWNVINAERKDTQQFREKILEGLRDVPTKGDLEAMERRLAERMKEGRTVA